MARVEPMVIAGFAYLSVRRDGIYLRASAPRDFASYSDLIAYPIRVAGHFGDHAHRCKRVLHPSGGPVRAGEMIELILEVHTCSPS